MVLMLLAPQPLADARPEDHSPPEAIVYGDDGAWVASLNDRLAAAGFHADDEDVFGRQTRHAVFSFQKHHGLDTDGVFTAEMWPLLQAEIALPYKPELNRMEVDLGKQVLYIVEDGEVSLVLPISSASGSTYRNQSGGISRASTPEGRYTIGRTITGWRHAFLGSLYNPFYFKGGYAIHGSSSVPNYPASHGCIRTTMWDMDLIKSRIGVGWTVYVYGKRTSGPAPLTVSLPAPVSL
jgi:hypothetical protein